MAKRGGNVANALESRAKDRELAKTDYSKYDFSYSTKNYEVRFGKGLSEEVVRKISEIKKEPGWMLEFRLRALKAFNERPMPKWGADLSPINFDEIIYYMSASGQSMRSWDEVPKQVKDTFDRLGIPQAERKFLAGVEAQYDCLTADTTVYTNPKGPVRIIDVKTGDTVFAINEKTREIVPAKVKNVWCAGKKPIFEVKIKNRSIKASENHPFLALKYEKTPGRRKGNYKLEWAPLRELKKGTLIAIAKKYPDFGKPAKLKQPEIIMQATRKNQFGKTSVIDISHIYNKVRLPVESDEDLMWLFGFFLGDGYIKKNEKNRSNARINFAIPEDQQEVRNELRKILKALFGYELKSAYKYYVSINSAIITKFFEENGFIGNAKTKKVPEWVFSLPKTQILSFLAGFMDADGNVRNNKKNHDVVLTSVNIGLLESMKNLATYCGIECSNIWSFSSKAFGKEIKAYRINLNGNTAQLPSRHPEKSERLCKKKYYHHNFSARGEGGYFKKYCTDFVGFARIDDILLSGEELTYDIEVDDFHNFVANGLIVHNSEVMYHNIRKDLETKGVVFLSMDEGLKQYPALVKEHFGKVIPINDNKFASLNSAVWSGGCMPADTMVFTANRGTVKISEISPSDVVYSLNTATKKIEPDAVVASIYSGNKEVFEFLVAGRKVKATGNHKFLVLTKSGRTLNQNGQSWKQEWKSLEDLKIGDFIAVPKKLPAETNWNINLPKLEPYIRNTHLNRLKVPEEANEQLMWMLGIIIGDGNIHRPNEHMCHINIALPKSDSAREPAIKAVEELFGYVATTQDDTSFSIYSKELGKWINTIGICGTAHEKRIPQWAFSLPEKIKLGLLAGVLDADGYIESENGVIAIDLCNSALVEDIKLLAISCGFYSDGKILQRIRQNPFKSRLKRQNGSETVTSYRCRISGNIAKIPTRKTEWAVKLRIIHGKKMTFDKYNASSGKNFSSQTSEYLGFAPIREKKSLGEMSVFDIQTEKNHNFIANGIFAHNSFVYVPKNVKVDIPLQAYFRINSESFGQFERTMIIADEGSQIHYVEGCFTAGTEIRTENGIKPIEQIEKGEKVLTHKGQHKEVYFTQARPYTGKLHTILVRGDTVKNIEATEEHPIFIARRERLNERNKSFKPGWIEARNAKAGDYVCYPINKKIISNPYHEFEISSGNSKGQFTKVKEVVKADKDFFKLAGYFLSEGSTNRSFYTHVSFNVNEKEYISETKELFTKVFGIQKFYEPVHVKNNGISIVVSSAKISRVFEYFGRKSDSKFIPEWMMQESPEKQAELIKGIFNGDGSYMKQKYDYGTKEMFRINTTSEKLAKQIREILLRLEIASSLNKQFRKAPRKDIYAIVVGGEYLKKFGDIVGIKTESRMNNRKRATFYSVDEDYMYAPIKSIIAREVVEIPVYNFGVRDDESYTANGLAVHNCTAPKFSSQSLHSAVVEIIAKPNSHVTYTTIQNWSDNIYNLVTKRAFAYRNATVSWIDGNLGAKVTMKYPAIYLMEEGAKGEVLSVALAGAGQHQDAGAKVVHLASNTTSTVNSKSISKDGGRTSYRGLVKVVKGCRNVKSNVQCDALLLDPKSRTDTYPYVEVDEPTATIAHEATVGKIGEEQIFYLTSRGLTQAEALTLIVLGFMQPFTKTLPLEYAVELNRLIEMEMENSVG